MEIVKNIVKKLRRAEERKIEDEIPAEDLARNIIPDKGEEADVETEKLMERINEIENELPSIDTAINTLKKDVAELRNEIGRINESVKDIMMLYEVVSSQINPFIGVSKLTAVSMEKLEKMEKEMQKITAAIEDIIVDLKLLALEEFDIGKIIHDVLTEVEEYEE